jgi:hypothetical protein
MNDVYCPLIHHGLYLERTDADHSRIGPCCAAQHQAMPNSQIDFDSNSFLTKLRQENAQGIPSAACKICYTNEKHSASSLRTSSLEYYQNHHAVGLVNIDYNVDPICNGKCIICSQQHSSAWLAEDIKFGLQPEQIIRTAASSRANQVVEKIDLSKLNRIYFNGGEPVLSNDPVILLTKLKDLERLNQVEVAFNMNGSTKPSPTLVELLKQAKNVVIFFSIDGTGEQFEYIRNPIKWTDVLETVRYVAALDIRDLTIFSTCTIGIHNVDYLDDWYHWWYSYTSSLYSVHAVEFNSTTQMCTGPLDIIHAPKTVKQQWLDELRQGTPWYNQLVGVVQEHMEYSSSQWQDHLDRLDQRRNNSWKHSLERLYHRTK